jgi:hypothetical protein
MSEKLIDSLSMLHIGIDPSPALGIKGCQSSSEFKEGKILVSFTHSRKMLKFIQDMVN